VDLAIHEVKMKMSNHRLGLIQVVMSGLLVGLGMTLQFSCGTRNELPQRARQLVGAVKPGIEVFLEGRLDLVKGKKIGLITNPTGMDSRLRSDIDLMKQSGEFELIALYGPEHGVRGNVQGGVYIPFYFDDKYRIPVFSLYGQSLKPDPGMLKDMDEYMRSFDGDAKGQGKIPEGTMIKDIDALVFDIQDVGTRVYTYAATMAYAMQTAAQSGIPFIVLDRPNPINGLSLEGPVLEYPEFSSFIGLYPIPERHGMTAGELALMINDRFLGKKADLTVVPMQGWRREMWFDDTGLPWVIPSPNMPTLDTATVYPGQVCLEGTNVSEGRGTTKPFEIFGAPWVDGFEFARKLNGLGLPGVTFREAWFTPSFSKFAGEPCGGAQVHVTDRNSYRPFETALHVVKTIREMYPDKFQFHADYFDKVMGTAKVREALERGLDLVEIVKGYEPGLKIFAEERKRYLLYE
jgi:uncharacterized protein YbbC (DUF1343 family)